MVKINQAVFVHHTLCSMSQHAMSSWRVYGDLNFFCLILVSFVILLDN